MRLLFVLLSVMALSACFPKKPTPTRDLDALAPYEEPGNATVELAIDLLTRNADRPIICDRVYAYVLPDIDYYNVYLESARDTGIWWDVTNDRARCDREDRVYRQTGLAPGAYNAVIVYEERVLNKWGPGLSVRPCKMYTKNIRLEEDEHRVIDMNQSGEEVSMVGCDPLNLY